MRYLGILLLLFFATVLPVRGDDNVVNVHSDDAEMNAAIDEARASLPRFLDAWGAGQVGDMASVKVALAPGGASAPRLEHIWVTDFERQADGGFRGRLDNDPEFLPNLQMGSIVEFDLSMVSDWTFMRDGLIYGNYTARVLVARMSGAEADAFRKMVAPDPVPADWQ